MNRYERCLGSLQEVDRLEKLLPPLHAKGYAHTYAAGRGKKHGCMIIHQKAKLQSIHERTVYFDELDVHRPSLSDVTETESPEEIQRRKGSSRRTKNIALIVALKKNSATPDGQVQGYIVATCHLFWHPQYVYERVRYVLFTVTRNWRASDLLSLSAKAYCFFERSPASKLIII